MVNILISHFLVPEHIRCDQFTRSALVGQCVRERNGIQTGTLSGCDGKAEFKSGHITSVRFGQTAVRRRDVLAEYHFSDCRCVGPEFHNHQGPGIRDARFAGRSDWNR